MNILALVPSWSEMLIAIAVGLLLFGGRLPQVAKDIGRTFFRFRNSMNDLRRESGIEDAIQDLKEEASQIVDVEIDVKEEDDSPLKTNSKSKSVEHPGD